MNYRVFLMAAICGIASLSLGVSQTVKTKTTWVPLPSSTDAVLIEPETPGPKSRIGIIYTYPSVSNLRHTSGPELAKRGYRVLLQNQRADPIGYEAMAPHIGNAVNYMRALPGIEKVVLLSHSAGGPLITFYQNLAENGPQVCQGPEKIFPCKGDGLTGLPKGDAVVLLDSHLGEGFRMLTYLDPAVTDEGKPSQRDPQLDMFDPRNGYNRETDGANYSEDFTRKFFAAQAARNEKLIAAALARWKAIQSGVGDYQDDEPFMVPEGGGARPLQADLRLVSRTRNPHPLLKPEGKVAEQIAHSIHPPMGRASGAGSYEQSSRNSTSVRRFLAAHALRTTGEYNMTQDAITGIDWASSSTSAPSNIRGVTVPLLIMSMSCHYFLLTDEILYDNAASRDKQYVVVEGASHGFSPCKPEFGDTTKRTFDYIDTWLSDPRRLAPR